MKETVKIEASDKKLGMTLDEVRAFVQRLDGADGSVRVQGQAGSWKQFLQWLSVTVE